MNGNDYIIPSAVAPAARRRLAETIGWCSSRTTAADFSRVFRSAELEPDHQFYLTRRLPEGNCTFDPLTTYERALIVENLADKRAFLLAERGIAVHGLTTDLMGGRLLTFAIDGSVWDGLSGGESQGFFDVYDNPAWDTWVHLQHVDESDVLLCWVPPPLIALVNDAIAVNCTSCIGWVDGLREG